MGETTEIAWRPDERTIAESNLTALMRALGCADYDDLVARSAAEPEWFWDALIRHLDFRFYEPYGAVLDTSDGIEWARWCVGGKTNLVLNCIDRWRGTGTWSKPAVVWDGESGETRTWSYAELDAEICRLANALRALGIGEGDVVALYMPMLPEAPAAFFAIAKVGAVVMPLFSGFAADAMAARMGDADAKAIITADGGYRRGKAIDMKAMVDQAIAQVPSVEHVIVLRHVGIEVAWTEGRDHRWSDLVAPQAPEAPTAVLDAEAPVMIVYTSGTTGMAKGTVHAHCGFGVKCALDFRICLDARASDRCIWVTDMGWLMGPILVTGPTLAGATMVLMEGAPNYPTPDRLWRLLGAHRVSFLGIAPTVVRALINETAEGIGGHDFSGLRLIASTGEPWNHDSWLWAFHNIGGGRLPILNYTGGTEVGGGILSATVIHPMKPCSFAGPVPGSGAAVVDAAGRDLGPGEVGELVMRQPSIGLTRGLWRDPERYLETYWRKIPGLWVQGDFASIDADGFWYVFGRSDDTINVAGKRTGPAELESILLETGLIEEAAVIGVPDAIKGSALVCACVGGARDAATAQALSDAVAAKLGHAFRPREIVFVEALPKTRSMKIMRRVVRAIYTGEPPGDLASLVNPEAIPALEAALQKRRKNQ